MVPKKIRCCLYERFPTLFYLLNCYTLRLDLASGRMFMSYSVCWYFPWLVETSTRPSHADILHQLRRGLWEGIVGWCLTMFMRCYVAQLRISIPRVVRDKPVGNRSEDTSCPRSSAGLCYTTATVSALQNLRICFTRRTGRREGEFLIPSN